MARLLTWLASGFLTAAVTTLALLPAGWMAAPLERMSSQRLTLADAQGTVWRGSAVVGTASGGKESVSPLLPGRFSWRLSPMILVGRVDARIENAAALSLPVEVTGTWTHWRVTPAGVSFPANGLFGLGAPFNTIGPSGRVRLSWGPVELARDRENVAVNGTIAFDIDDVSSLLSPIKPLGAYRLTMGWQGRDARMVLETKRGPMLLSGTGDLADGRWRFSGRAQAAAGYDKSLANFLNLLGESGREGDKDVIAIVLQ